MVIDSLEFASRGGKAAGHLPLNALPRLNDLLADASGGIDYEVSGESSGRKAFIAVRLEGRLPLVCQRCLGTVHFELRVRNRLLLVLPGSSWPEDGQPGGLDDEFCDAIEASHELDLVTVLEEEVLLALPIVPRHESCELPATILSAHETSPFIRLAGLKRN